MKTTEIIGRNPLNIKYQSSTICDKRKFVKFRLFELSGDIKSEDFTHLSEADLYILYELYDEIFLNGWFKNNFKGKIIFKLSRQLKIAAGNTRVAKNIEKMSPESVIFEVKISLRHLMHFDDADRVKTVGGIVAQSRLDSLMLVFEHELCHVIEFLSKYTSDCKGPDYRVMIKDLFGHVEPTHNLVSQAESNWLKYGLKSGDAVCFNYDGRDLTGVIVRINKNASVMSLDDAGRYADRQGRRYSKYSVPVNMLRKI